MKNSLAALALAAAAAGAPPAAHAAWLGLDDGDYAVSLQCTSSTTLDCTQAITGNITVSGAGLSAIDFLIDGLSFGGDPMDYFNVDGTGSSEGSVAQAQPYSFLALRLVTEGEVLGYAAGERFWAYCSPWGTASCLVDTVGTWSVRAVGTVDEPPGPAIALLALAVAGGLSASARRRPAAA